MTLNSQDILNWLREDAPDRLQALWGMADTVRRQHVGHAVHLRGLVEISSYCTRHCHYCGLRAPNTRLPRYRMTPDDILASAQEIAERGYGTIVLQAGEDDVLDSDWLCPLLREIKSRTPLAVTLSLGERTERELARLRHAGADRYLLRFETSNTDLFHRIHPPRGRVADHHQNTLATLPPATTDHRDPVDGYRIALLGVLRRLGYEVGSGVMLGIPGQTYMDLARDIQLFARLDLDMIGIGPYIPHPETPLGRAAEAMAGRTDDQVPASDVMTYKTVALTRLVCPRANIPCTSALATINAGEGRILALQRGANVIMPNMTPERYRRSYEIYPNKAGTRQTRDENDAVIRSQIRQAGRTVGQGRGDSRNLLTREPVSDATNSPESQPI